MKGPEPGTLIQHFKDDATAFNAKKHEVIEGKGVLNNRISEYVFQHLNDIGVPTHFIRRLNMREQLIREVEIIPLEVVVRNVAAGSLAQRPRHRGRHAAAALDHRVLLQERQAQRPDGVRKSTSRPLAGRRRRRSTTSWRSPSASMIFLSGLFLGVGIRPGRLQDGTGRLWENDVMRIVVADEISPDQLPAVGHQVERQARQGPLPPRSRRPARGLYRSGQAPWHHERRRAPARHRTGPGERLTRIAL
jgi:phosphoribosylaminoimidazole-succinocarboxamide synthase